MSSCMGDSGRGKMLFTGIAWAIEEGPGLKTRMNVVFFHFLTKQ